MSDLEDMDTDRLNELESILYASIHYNDATSDEQQQQHALDMALDAQTMPPPSSQQMEHRSPQQQQQQNRIVNNKRIVNNATAKPRYWAEAKNEDPSEAAKTKTHFTKPVEATTTEEASLEPPQPVSSAAAAVNPSPKKKNADKTNPNQNHPKTLNTVQRLLQQQQQKQQPQKKQHQLQKKQQQIQKPPKPQQQVPKANSEYDEPERFDQRLLVAIPCNWPVATREPAKIEPAKIEPGPFGKSSRKLEQLQRLAQKRQKSKRAQSNKKLRKIENHAIEFIDLAESDKSSDTDDVVIVPLPPIPIIDVDTSNEEKEEPTMEEPQEKQLKLTAEPYLEENAMDAADVSLETVCVTGHVQTPSTITSPCNSVLSSDDFIVQKDTSRLLADHARATDDDLLVLIENAIRDAGEPTNSPEGEQTLDSSSEYEFVPPSRLEEIKQNYRVGEQQFRALDVYESESDLTETGIYCKGKQKAPTIIRNVDSESDISDVEQVVESNVVKTKRLRKRRASSTNQSQSDPNNEPDKALDTETDSDDGVHSTGVPGIARGMAVERCKRKIRRLSLRRSSESTVTGVPLKAPADDGSLDSVPEESLPTARQIAERLLQQEQEKEKETEQIVSDYYDETMDSIGSDANTEDEAEMNDAITERISAVFERIDEKTRSYKRKLNYEESEPDPMPHTIDIAEQSEEDTTELEMVSSNFQSEQTEEQKSEPESTVQVEHNVAELKEELRSRDIVGWNDEMCRFYNDSWHGERFNVNKLLKSLNPNRSGWRVNSADRYPVQRKRSHLKCNNCFEMGHVRSKCTRPRKPVACYACGMTGHAEPRCPNAICLGCGAKQSLYVQKCNKCSFHSRMICQLCKMRGHSTELCPDKWRRYHSTTRTNEPLETNVVYNAKNCSNCGARGHLFEECRQRIGEYKGINYSSIIISHQKVYKDRSGPLNYLSDLPNFFAVETPFHFKWTSEFSKNSFYGRFLQAVDLVRPVSTPAIEQQKIYTNDYVPNPQAKAARSLTTTTKTSSVIIEELPANSNDTEAEAVAVAASTTDSPETEQIQQMEISSNFQNNPIEAATTTASTTTTTDTTNTITTSNNVSSTVPAATSSKSSITPHDLDSDSNYSFSEHFEVASSTTVSNEVQAKSGPMDALPDIIPLSVSDENNDLDLNIISYSQGISMCVNSKATAASSSTKQAESLPDDPSEAKILMAHDQTQYLFSPEGRLFLSAAAKECNVNIRMDFKEYGYVLVIYGQKKNQEDLQLMLLRRHQEVKRKTTEFQSQKPPRRIDVLIRFLRDGINSLSGNLGNPKNHFSRIKELEQMNTKNGYKLAERKRRLLNMILFGQAGLNNGNMHLDQLLLILKRLVEEHASDENASPAMRNEIEEHWRVIFSPFAHPNYESLLQSYSKLDVKNRIATLDIEPAVLGLQNAVRKTHTPQQKDLSNSPPPPPPVWHHQDAASPAAPTNNNNNKLRSPKQRALLNAKWSDQEPPPPPAWPNEERAPAPPSMHQQQNTNNRSPKQRSGQQRPAQRAAQQQQQSHPQGMLPCNNLQQQRGSAKLQLRRKRPLKWECTKLLAGMERDSSGSINTDASKPSMFWSRESLKYLDDLFKIATNPQILERLNRVLERSRRGQLSHNDYRAVIRLHTLMEPN